MLDMNKLCDNACRRLSLLQSPTLISDATPARFGTRSNHSLSSLGSVREMWYIDGTSQFRRWSVMEWSWQVVRQWLPFAVSQRARSGSPESSRTADHDDLLRVKVVSVMTIPWVMSLQLR